MGKSRNVMDVLVVIGLPVCMVALWFMKTQLIFDPVTDVWILKY